MKEDIVLESYTGQNVFTFMLNTGGLNLYSANGRYYLAESKVATDRIELGDLVTFDANGRFSVGTMTSQTVTAGNIYRLTLTVDEAFLTDPNTVYPVSIDPTITITDNTTVGSIEDVTLYEGVPTLNTGTWTYHHCGYYDDTYGRARPLFRLTGLANSAYYQRSDMYAITSAKFYIKEASGTSALTVHLYENHGNSNWTESNATWNNVGNVLGDRYATASVPRSAYAVFDITSLVHVWQSSTRPISCGFFLVSSNETDRDKALYSSEFSTAANRPYAVVTYGFDLFYSDSGSADYYKGTKLTTDYYYDSLSNELYEFPIYEDDSLQLRANCYGYAFRFYFSYNYFPTELQIELENGNIYQAYKQQPGEFADKTDGLVIQYSDTNSITLYDYCDLNNFLYSLFIGYYTPAFTMNSLVQLMQADAATLGYTLTEYTGTTIPDSQLGDGKRLIAVVTGSTDFHFYMQHSDNTWSHKPGSDAPQDVCISCDPKVELTNDTIRAHACEGRYANGALKFFYITKNAVVDYGHLRGTRGIADESADCAKTSLWIADLAGNCFIASKEVGQVPVSHTSSRIDYIGDEDYYAFYPASSGSYSFTTSSTTSIPLQAKLYDCTGTLLKTTYSATGSISYTYQLTAGKNYFIVFSSPNQEEHKQTAYYQFSISAN